MLKQIGTWKLRWKLLAIGLVLLIAVVTLTDAKPKPQNDANAQSVVDVAVPDEADAIEAGNSFLRQELDKLMKQHEEEIALLNKQLATKQTVLERLETRLKDLQEKPMPDMTNPIPYPPQLPQKADEKESPKGVIICYQLKNMDENTILEAEKSLQLLMPEIKIKAREKENMLVIIASPDEHEIIQRLLPKADIERNIIPNLKLELIGPSEILHGKEGRYQLRIRNLGDKDLHNLKVVFISNGLKKGETQIDKLPSKEERELGIHVECHEENVKTLHIEIRVEDANGRVSTINKTIEVLQPDTIPANLPVQVPVPHDPVPQMVQQVQPAEKSVMVYRLLHRSPEQAEDLIRNMFPMLSIQTERSTNSVIVTCSREEKEIVREILQKADVPAVAEPVPPQPSDPFAGKYLIEGNDDEAGKRSGLELTYLGNNRSPQRLLSDNMRWTNDATGTYRIVQYAGGLPGDGYDETQGRMIGTATLDGNKLSIDWEVVHDGKRYLPLHKEVITGDNPDTITGKFVRDGDTTLLMLLLPDTRPGLTDVPGVRFVSTVAVKVGE